MTGTTQTHRDELGEKLIEAGFATNGYLLDINGSLRVPHTFELPAPWNLPSRLFRNPIEISTPRNGHPRRIGLMHPDLADHPYVRHVEATLGIELDRDGAPNEYGFSNRRTGQWWHAVDLISTDHWRELLETSDFTTPGSIFHAIVYGLRYSNHDEDRKRAPHISTRDARAMMDELGAFEPTNRAAIICELDKPSACKSDGKTEHWPINGRASSPEDEAWAFIFGIEDGWFNYDRAGFLVWTEKGRDRYAAGDSITFTETSGQTAMAF